MGRMITKKAVREAMAEIKEGKPWTKIELTSDGETGALRQGEDGRFEVEFEVADRTFIAKGKTLRALYDELGHCIDDAGLLIADPTIDLGQEAEELYEGAEFRPGMVKKTRQQLSVATLVQRIERETIAMSAAFQRSCDVWSRKQKSRLIESMLLDMEIPTIYLDATEGGSAKVIDGLQRLSALRDFVLRGMKLVGLEILTGLNGTTFEPTDKKRQQVLRATEEEMGLNKGELKPNTKIDPVLADALSDEVREFLEGYQVTVVTILPPTPSTYKYALFERLNTGGVSLNAMECRVAANQGFAYEFICDLAREPEDPKRDDSVSPLQNTLGKVTTKRQQDLALALRWWTFHNMDLQTYNGNLKGALNEAMGNLSDEPLTDEEADEAVLLFKDTCLTVAYLFEDMAGKLPRGDKMAKSVNAFEAQFVGVSRYIEIAKKVCDLMDDGQIERDAVRNAFVTALVEDPEFDEALRGAGTSKPIPTRKRIQTVGEILDDVFRSATEAAA